MKALPEALTHRLRRPAGILSPTVHPPTAPEEGPDRLISQETCIFTSGRFIDVRATVLKHFKPPDQLKVLHSPLRIPGRFFRDYS